MAWNLNNTEVAYCNNCGRSFTRHTDEKWKKLCLDCYIAKKEREKQSNYSNNNLEASWLRRRLEAVARRLFPDAELSRKKDHNRADALLLAWWAKQYGG